MIRTRRGVEAFLKPLVVLFFVVVALLFALMTAKGFREPLTPSAPGEPTLSNKLHRDLADILEELGSLRVHRLRPQWELEVGGNARLALCAETLLVALGTGSIICVEASTGAVRWSQDLGAWISAEPTAWNGIVFAGTANRLLFALDHASGALLWTFTADGEILSSPVVSDGILYLLADNSSLSDFSNLLYALDAASGALLWQVDSKSWTPSPPTVNEWGVFTAGSSSTVMALEKRTGEQLWSREIEGVVYSSLPVGAGKVFVSTIDGWLYAMDASSGAVIWKQNVEEFTPSSPLLAGDSLCINYYETRLTALSPEDGSIRWTLDAGGLMMIPSCASPNRVYTYFPRGVLFVLDARSGKRTAAYAFPSDFARPPRLGQGQVFAVSTDGFVRAYPAPGIDLVE